MLCWLPYKVEFSETLISNQFPATMQWAMKMLKDKREKSWFIFLISLLANQFSTFNSVTDRLGIKKEVL